MGGLDEEAPSGSEAAEVSPGHGLDLQALLYAVGQRLLVVVFADARQHPLLVGFVLVAAGINLAWNARKEALENVRFFSWCDRNTLLYLTVKHHCPNTSQCSAL